MKSKHLISFSTGERKTLSLILLASLISGVIVFRNEAESIITNRNEEGMLLSDSDVVLKENPVDKLILKQPEKKKALFFNNKLKAGETIDLNTSDTTLLKKIPGIGSSFAKRIVAYRDLLGGYAEVSQLKEVYGIDSEKYNEISKWFVSAVQPPLNLNVNTAEFKTLLRHPYLNKEQTKAIFTLRERDKRIESIQSLELLPQFSEQDISRLKPYLVFE